MNRFSWTGGRRRIAASCLFAMTLISSAVGLNATHAQAEREVTFPPSLPSGESVATDRSPRFLEPSKTLKKGVAVAETPPTVDFLYYPGQDYPGEPWSVWGDGTFADGKYVSAIGDHLAIGLKGDGSRGNGTARVFAYDPQAKSFSLLADTTKTLALPRNVYSPGKIHSRIDQGSDGWLYFATHRGSEKVTTDENGYAGDWILRCRVDGSTDGGSCEVVAQAPVPKHAMPASILDPERLIFYGGTAAGLNSGDAPDDIRFFAYDLAERKLLYTEPEGPARALMFSLSTGRVYWTQGKQGIADGAVLMRYRPDENGGKPKKVAGDVPGLRAATAETPQGLIYAVSQGGEDGSTLWSFDPKSESIEKLGPAAVDEPSYITTIDADPSGRYLYYVPGAHGDSVEGDSAIVQFDTRTKRKKILAFLNPFYAENYGVELKGTFGAALDENGETLFVTWNVSRGSRHWETCALTAIHIPATERETEGER
jgi:hypothetical protein